MAEIFRFIMTGGLNTILTIALYQLLVTYINPEVSYALAWLAGFVFIAIAYPKYVFRSDSRSTGKIVLLAILYAVSFSLGLFLMFLFIKLGLHERLSVFVVIAITSSVNFIFAKWLFGNRNKLFVSEAEK